MPGPAKKPTNLKILEGNPGKRKLPAYEPQPSRLPGVPKCPAYIKGTARKEWEMISKELHVLGLLTRIDHAALEAYCIVYQQFLEAEQELARVRREYREALRWKKKHPKDERKLPSNGLVSYTSNGNAIMEPLLSVRKQAMEQMHKFLVEFGMTPASRSRIEVDKAKKSDDPMEDLIDHGQRQN